MKQLIRQITSPNDIRTKTVRLVLPTGSGSSIVDKQEAFNRAFEEGLEMVLLSEENGDEPPVVKICDIHKIEYHKQKTTGGGKNKKTKHVRIGPHTAEHDLARIANCAVGFIKEGHNVVLQMEVKGRDRTFSHLLNEQVQRFVTRIPCAKPGRITHSANGGTAMYTCSLT